MGFTLYVDLRSQPCRAVYLFLKKSGIEYKQVNLDLFKGEHKTNEKLKAVYKEAPPTVPTLIDDGGKKDFDTSESTAIISHIATKVDKENAKKKSPPAKLKEIWYGTDDESSTRVTEFTGWQGSGLRAHCVKFFLGMLVGGKSFEESDEEAKKGIENAVNRIADHYLGDKDFIGGSKISVADLLGACELYQLHGIDQLEYFLKFNKDGKVKKWLERVEKQLAPHWKTANAGILAIREDFMKKASAQSAKK